MRQNEIYSLGMWKPHLESHKPEHPYTAISFMSEVLPFTTKPRIAPSYEG